MYYFDVYSAIARRMCAVADHVQNHLLVTDRLHISAGGRAERICQGFRGVHFRSERNPVFKAGHAPAAGENLHVDDE